MLELAKRVYSNVDKKKLYQRVKKYDLNARKEILGYCTTAQELRTAENCARYFKGKYSVQKCGDIIRALFYDGEMGAYCMGEGLEPQPFMQEYILKNFKNIDEQSKIMEVGPGNFPLFNEEVYKNWYSCDINYDGSMILFSEQEWAKNKYKKIYQGCWENLSEVCNENGIREDFDLVCGSHSFEHCHRPIKALEEAAKILKPGGVLVLFVPDGYSTWYGNFDMTHAMYLVPEMVEDLFSKVEGFAEVKCEQFRKNMDLVISAKKIGNLGEVNGC